jgi:hypothetical protein
MLKPPVTARRTYSRPAILALVWRDIDGVSVDISEALVWRRPLVTVTMQVAVRELSCAHVTEQTG